MAAKKKVSRAPRAPGPPRTHRAIDARAFRADIERKKAEARHG